MAHQSIAYGTTVIEYELIYTRRRTLGITVHPDQRVTVRAPLRTSMADIEAVVRRKGGWILKKQQEFEDYPPAPPPRRYVSGETHLYLGQGYRLVVSENKEQGVQLANGRLFLQVKDKTDLERKKKLLENWYRRQAKIIFAERLEAIYPRAARHGIPYPKMKIRLMKSRWGSCSSKGNINLNLRLIQTPTACIDYVIIHELAHLKEHNHGRSYYTLLDKLLPDWRERREVLNRIQVA
jgi:predicted metal-dependent hydrolase